MYNIPRIKPTLLFIAYFPKWPVPTKKIGLLDLNFLNTGKLEENRCEMFKLLFSVAQKELQNRELYFKE